MIFKFIDMDDLIKGYDSGMSVKALAEKFGVARGTIINRLRSKGIIPRTRSEALTIRMAQASQEERSRLTAAAHNAVRNRRQSFEEKAKRATARQINGTGISPIETKFRQMLLERGIQTTAQRAIGPYNVDLSLDEFPIIIEIFGGQWHSSDSHAAGFQERVKYLLGCGYLPIFIWVTKYYLLETGAADYIISLVEKLRRGESVGCKEIMIRGDGQICTIGKSKLYHIPFISGSQPRDKTTGQYKLRVSR